MDISNNGRIPHITLPGYKRVTLKGTVWIHCWTQYVPRQKGSFIKDLVLSLIGKRVVPNYLNATNPAPPRNDPQCGWEGRTGYACWDEAPRKQLGMLKRMLLGNFLEQGDVSQFQSSNISWKQSDIMMYMCQFNYNNYIPFDAISKNELPVSCQRSISPQCE